MRTRNSLVTLLLVTTLLLAPVSLAGPSGSAGFGWFSQVKAFVVDVFDFFGFGESTQLVDPGAVKPQVSNVCGEGGSYPDPTGCPG